MMSKTAKDLGNKPTSVDVSKNSDKSPYLEDLSNIKINKQSDTLATRVNPEIVSHQFEIAKGNTSPSFIVEKGASIRGSV